MQKRPVFTLRSSVFPIAYVLFLAVGFLISYFLAILLSHARTFFPSIDLLSEESPESYVMTIMTFCACILMACTVLIQSMYYHGQGLQHSMWYWKVINVIGLMLGISAAVFAAQLVLVGTSSIWYPVIVFVGSVFQVAYLFVCTVTTFVAKRKVLFAHPPARIEQFWFGWKLWWLFMVTTSELMLSMVSATRSAERDPNEGLEFLLQYLTKLGIMAYFASFAYDFRVLVLSMWMLEFENTGIYGAQGV